jgi:hypothetical protein
MSKNKIKWSVTEPLEFEPLKMFGQWPVYPTGFEFFKENCSEKGRTKIAEVTKKLMPYQNPSRYYYYNLIN